jgi:hypothetical protein
VSPFNEDRGAFILLAGGILLIVSLFLPHWESGWTAWHVFSNLKIIILLIGIFAIGFGLLEASGATATLPAPVPLVLAALGLAVFGFSAGWELQISGAGGVWMAVAGSIAIGVGGWGVRRHDLVVRASRAPGALPGDGGRTAAPERL